MDQACSSSAQPGSVVQVCFPGVRAAVLDNLNRQREEGRLCDLSIQVQGQVFRAHRCVLAASSPYFHDQVLLKNVTTVSLPSVMDPVAFDSVLSSAYTGQLSIVRDDIVNYVTVASFLQMWHIVDKCTEILKRPRPPAECSPADAAATHYGSSSRQQSPSSTNCLYLEREGRGKERKSDTLPPLATWRRPQQFPRYGRPRSSPAQHLADSQLDCMSGCRESDYSSFEEVWMSSHTKGSTPSHEVHGPNSRHHGGVTAEAQRLRTRLRQRTKRPLERDTGSGESHLKRFETREVEADEGTGGEIREEKRDRSEHKELPGDFNLSLRQSGHVERPVGKVSSDEKTDEQDLGTDPDITTLQSGEADHDNSVPLCPAPAPAPAPASQEQWQASPWSQLDGKPQDEEEDFGKEDEEGENVDFGQFADGTFGRSTFDEIEDTGQVSQRPLVPASPDNTDYNLVAPEISWPSASNEQASGAGGAITPPSSSRLLSPPSSQFPPSSSPPIPSSSSSLALAGAPYTGKVHFCHCGKAYTLKSMRDRHVKMQHLNLRPFGCPVCAKTFKMKHHLTKHLKTHGGLRPYECVLCGKKVIWRDSFLRHQARCERLAANYNGPSAHSNSGVAAASIEDGFGYGFEAGPGFLAGGGQVKVEEVDFNVGEVEDGISGLLGRVGGVGDQPRTQSRSIISQVFKEEASERFS